MSNRKRKQRPPERFSEDKRAELTWNMLDFHLPASGSTYQTTMNFIDSSSVNDETNTPTASSPRKKKKRQKAFDRNRSIELNLENSYPQTCVCQLGLFNINLCTSETQRDELKSQNGTGISDDLWTVDCYHCVVIKLSFEPQHSIKDDKNLFELNNGCLRQASFKATVPSVSTHQLEALVYLQNKGVISLVLKPEQHILKESWEVVVCLKENGLTEMSSACADVKNRKIDQLMKVLIEWFYNISARGDDSVLLDCNNAGVDKDFDELYNAIKAVRESNCSSTSVPRSSLSNTPLCHVLDTDKDNNCSLNAEINRCNGANDFDVQHPHLRPVLRGYQRRAVEWMLQRELAHQVTSGCQRKEIDAHSLHPLWQKIHSLDGKMIYYSPYTGRLTKERFCQPSLPLGGILADEMGLGKTVEVIACILCHSKPSSEGKSFDYTLTASEPHTDTSSTCNSMIQEGSKSKLAECENNDCDEAVTGHSSNKEPTLCENSPPLCNGHIAREMKGTTEKGDSSSHDSGHSTTSSNKDLNELSLGLDGQKMAKTSSVIYTSDEESATQFMKCQCICGINLASVDDKLLQCCECQAVFYATCLGYDYPGSFLCPHCAVSRPATPSRATLIISPAPIAQQWVEEISKHTQPSTVKLLVYEGVAKMGFIPPQVLADHDVILTTYSTLRSDFYHLGSKQGTGGRSMRYEKRYVALPSPLTAVMFWRICLDEAQMVESTTAKAAEVALCLHSVHRWCVTGTPIQKGLEDIYGLLLFLGVDPYCHQKWWKSLLFEPYRNGNKQPLYELLAKILWRSVKKDVIHEIQLPEQDEKVKWLTFSPVEQHFYHRQHEECASTAMKMLSHWEKRDTMLSAIDRNTVHLLLNPLLRLRQACCHPQAVRGGFLSMQKSTLTMDKLLESLISKAKLECEEAHRQLLFAFNGLAGIHILKEEWPEAVEMYREATRSWTGHEETFRTDALQKLHTLFNLSDVLSQQHPGCSHTLRDDKLPDDVKELKNAYTTRVNLQVDSAKQNLDAAQSSHAETRQKVDMQSPWWVEALHSVAERGLDTDLCQRVQDELSSTDMDLGSIGRFKDLHGLQYIVSSKLELIESTHNNLLVSLDKLSVPATPQMVLASAECCLRPAQNSTAERCAFCQVDDIFTEYESRIFGHQGMKGVDEHNSQTDDTLDWHRHGNTGGLRAESEVEKVLKVIHNFIKTHKTGSTAHLQQEGRLHLSLIDGLRKEFKFLRALWFALRERISCLDELDMCTTRLRLLLPGEPVTDDIHVIHPLQIEQQRLKFMSDRVVAQTELRKKLGQLLYLKNLAKTQTSHDGKNPEPCPVCTKLLGVQWSVFSCGHCICCRCSWVLLRQAGIGPRHRNVHVKCPMCRIPTLAQEISYVSTGRSQDKDTEENVTVKGSHSTKVEAVVRTLLAIKSADNTAKSLVFSTWQEVLSVLAQALDENGIKYKHITGSRLFQSNLQTFKQDSSVGVLLLPLQTGSNGLNIIEATHVLLVEPAMNPAHELQAVGRVHRIGQTKPTHVYRFIIQGTVESRMYSLLQSKPTSCVRTGARDSENASLTLGDLASLFTQDEERDEEQSVTGSFLFYEPTDALSPD